MLAGVSDLAAHLGRPLTFSERASVRGLLPEIARRDEKCRAEADRAAAILRRKADRQARLAAYRESRKEETRVRLAASSLRGNEARRLRMSAAFVEVVSRLVVFENSAGICGICGEAVSIDAFAVDHIIPLAKDGEHSYANTQAAHKRCNSRKGARWIGGDKTRTPNSGTI